MNLTSTTMEMQLYWMFRCMILTELYVLYKSKIYDIPIEFIIDEILGDDNDN